MLYHFEKGHKAAEAFRDLNELFGEGTTGERRVRRWFERFKSGDTSLEDEGGRDRPSDFDDQVLLDAVKEDESLTTRLLAEMFNVDQSTIVQLSKQKVPKRGSVAKVQKRSICHVFVAI
uniref:Mos1 transposase HTH domain-containing protein n=1 Tax=Acrobeloides nanus TaxID=290746 RepID=A0A914EE60_9BILA